jgi:shikimate kinase
MGKALIFCGIKHCGKSTLGKTLARMMQVRFCDTDEMLEEKWQCSCRELFKSVGEEEFRRRESDLLKEIPEPEELCIISLGGGALLKEENLPVLQKLGHIIWCDVDDAAAFERVTANGLPPFLAQAQDPFAEFKKLNLSRRKIFAAVSALRFEAEKEKTPQENAKKLKALLLEKGLIGK